MLINSTLIYSDPVIGLGLLAFVFLLLALPFTFWSLFGPSKSKIVQFLLAISNLVLTFQLIFRWIQSGHFPISNLYESLCFLTWSCLVIQLFIERNFSSPLIHAFLTPLSLLTISFASFALPEQLQTASPLVPALRSSWLVMHVTVIMCSYAALILGSLLSLGVILTNNNQNKLQIRSNSIGVGIFRTESISGSSPSSQNINLPMPIELSDCEQLDNLSYRTITVGFLLLTFGLISGAVWANEAWGTWWSWDPKETWAFISWLVYAAYLHARLSKGWQGVKPAFIALFGSFVILICYIGVNLLGVGLHSYGWFL